MSTPADVYRSALDRGGIADLSDRAMLRFTGADRLRYLNGQVTADVRKAAPGEALPACVTTAKGRLCADVFVGVSAEALWVDADPSLHATLPARLERYIIADDVALEDLTGDVRLVHLVTAAAAEERIKALTIAVHRASRFGHPGFDLLVSAEQFTELWRQLSATFVVLDQSLLESLRIEAGIPRWGRELDEATLPPEAGLDRTHIDYHKGCYIGQEVISRLKSIGRVNRRLRGFVSPGDRPLQEGMELFAPLDGAVCVGRLTSAAWSFALETPVALGYLQRGVPGGDLFARAAGWPETLISPRELPLV